jgi:hypothetical protein
MKPRKYEGLNNSNLAPLVQRSKNSMQTAKKGLTLVGRVFAVFVISAAILFSPQLSNALNTSVEVHAAPQQNSNRYVRDDGVSFEKSSDGKVTIHGRDGTTMLVFLNIGTWQPEDINVHLLNFNVRELNQQDIDWIRGLNVSQQQATGNTTTNTTTINNTFGINDPTLVNPTGIINPVGTGTNSENAVNAIRPINEFPQFLNDNPETLPTNFVLYNIVRDFVQELQRDANRNILAEVKEPTQEQRQRNDTFVERMNENRHLDPASRAMGLNDEGMSLLLSGVDVIMPFIGEDGDRGFWNGRRIYIATHYIDDRGRIVPHDIDDIINTTFYEMFGRTQGFGVGLSRTTAAHFTGGRGREGAPGSELIPLFNRLGLHNVYANAFSDERISQFLGAQNLSAQEKQLLANHNINDRLVHDDVFMHNIFMQYLQQQSQQAPTLAPPQSQQNTGDFSHINAP